MSWKSCECFSIYHVKDCWHLSSVFGTKRQEEHSNNIIEIKNNTGYLFRREPIVKLHSDEQSDKWRIWMSLPSTEFVEMQFRILMQSYW